MLTIEDIRNPKRTSGFNYVWSAGGKGSGHGGGRPWVAHRNVSGVRWRGPRRDTPDEAAQDYCNYVNGQQAATPATLKTAGHEYTIDERDDDAEYQAALGVIRDRKAQRAGKQGYVYLITDGEYVKIGYSVNPQKRVAELQTGNARVLSLLGFIPGTEDDERRIQRKYIRYNVLQEWFTVEAPILAYFSDRVKHQKED